MCLPIIGAATLLNVASGVAGVASGVATAVGGVMGAVRQAETAEANSVAARDAYILETHLSGKRQREEQASLVAQRNDIQLQRMIGEAGAVNSAAAGGVGGATVNLTLGSMKANEAVARDRLNRNQEARDEQYGYENRSAQARAQARIDSVPPPTAADYFTPIARGLGQGFTALSDYRDLAQYDGE
jgi:hypothetical protein